MLRMKDVPPDQMAEVVRVAGELYDAEQAQTQERRATVAAAAEMGLPKEYLDRAASVVHARRVEQIATQRRRRAGLLVGIGVAATLGGGWFVTHPRPAAPLVYSFQPSQWTQESDPASKAAVTFANGAATLHVDHFAMPAGGDQFFVNLNTKDVPSTLAGYRTVSFRAQSAGLPNVRLYLESADERWRSAKRTPRSASVSSCAARTSAAPRTAPSRWPLAWAGASPPAVYIPSSRPIPAWTSSPGIPTPTSAPPTTITPWST